MQNHTRQFLAFVVAICFGTAAISQGHVLLRDAADSATITNATVFSRQSVIGYVFKDELTIINSFDDQQTAWLWALGYDSVVIALPLSHDTTIWMSRKHVVLEPVTVSAFPCTTSLQLGGVKGNLQRRHGRLMDRDGPGLPIHFQRALRIDHNEIGQTNCRIKRVWLYMPVTLDSQQGTVRLRIYDARQDTNLPGHDILHKEYLLSVVNDGRWYEVDISAEGLPVKGIFYVGFESMPTISGQLPEYGYIFQKSEYSTYHYHGEKNIWFQFIGFENWKRVPNLATRVELICPCID